MNEMQDSRYKMQKAGNRKRVSWIIDRESDLTTLNFNL